MFAAAAAIENRGIAPGNGKGKFWLDVNVMWVYLKTFSAHWGPF